MSVIITVLMLMHFDVGLAALFLAAAVLGAAEPNWVRFQDPKEQAFSLEVPAGWQVRGGLFRIGFSDYRPMVDLTSPDGRINVRLGDVLVPSYTAPNPQHPREGMPYDLGAQAQMMVARYRTGQEYAALYAWSRFHDVCQNVAPRNFDLLTPGDTWPPMNDQARTTEGQVSYQCTTASGPRVVYAYARTTTTGAIWQVQGMASFIAPPDQVAPAQAIVVRSSQSLRFNPQWIQQQAQMDRMGLQYQQARQQQRMAALGQQVMQFEARMRSMQAQVAAFQRGQAARQAQFQAFDNALVGVTPITDPLTGEHSLAWIGPKSGYWKDGTGHVINSDLQPGPGTRRMNNQ